MRERRRMSRQDLSGLLILLGGMLTVASPSFGLGASIDLGRQAGWIVLISCLVTGQGCLAAAFVVDFLGARK